MISLCAGNADPLFIACALNGQGACEESLFRRTWVVVSDDKTVLAKGGASLDAWTIDEFVTVRGDCRLSSSCTTGHYWLFTDEGEGVGGASVLGRCRGPPRTEVLTLPIWKTSTCLDRAAKGRWVRRGRDDPADHAITLHELSAQDHPRLSLVFGTEGEGCRNGPRRRWMCGSRS